MASLATSVTKQVVYNYRRFEDLIEGGYASSFVLRLSSQHRASYLVPAASAVVALDSDISAVDERGDSIDSVRIARLLKCWCSTVCADSSVDQVELGVYLKMEEEVWMEGIDLPGGEACREIMRKATEDTYQSDWKAWGAVGWEWEKFLRWNKRSRREDSFHEYDESKRRRVLPGWTAKQVPATLATLPTELHYMILEHLSNLLDRVRLKHTNKHFYYWIPQPDGKSLSAFRDKESHVRGLLGCETWLVCVGCERLRPGESFCDLVVGISKRTEGRLCIECGERSIPPRVTLREALDSTCPNGYYIMHGCVWRPMYYGPGQRWSNENGELWSRCRRCLSDTPFISVTDSVICSSCKSVQEYRRESIFKRFLQDNSFA